jgi:hypothetical protein
MPPYALKFGDKTAFNTIFAIGIVLMFVIIALSLIIKNYTFPKKAQTTTPKQEI